MRRTAVSAVLLTLGIIGLVATPAIAGQKNGPSTGSISVAGDPSFGQNMTLAANFSIDSKSIPEESVTCYVGSDEVYLNVQTGPAGATSWASTWMLSSSSWAAMGGQSASCTAQLYYYVWQGHSETSVVYLSATNFATS